MSLAGLAACVLISVARADAPAPAQSPTSAAKQETVAGNIYAITHVNVIPMTSTGEPVLNDSVVIEDKKIHSINGPIPDAAKLIDGKGRWLIPGLIDMHVHVPTDGNFNRSYPTRTAGRKSSGRY